LKDAHAITYASGLAATYAALVHFKPKRIAITGGYHGVHSTIRLYKQSRDVDVPLVDLDDEYQEGDLAWVETPLNPTGEARDIKHYADKVQCRSWIYPGAVRSTNPLPYTSSRCTL
jgi:cystathionine gamma-synthase